MAFDPTISLGTLVQIVVIVVGGIYALATMKNTVGNLKTQVEGMQTEIKKIAELMTTVAVQSARLDGMSERLNTLDRRYDEIRHGDGFVLKREG